MAKVSLSQAAKDNEISLPTLSRWRSKGRISAEKNDSGGYIIDTSEYDRIQTLKKQSPNMKTVAKGNAKDNVTFHEIPNEMRVLQVEVEVLRERIKDKDVAIEDLREDRDEWKKQAQTLLLQQPKAASEPRKDPEQSFQAPTLPEKSITPLHEQFLGRYGISILLGITVFILLMIIWFVTNNQIPKEFSFQ